MEPQLLVPLLGLTGWCSSPLTHLLNESRIGGLLKDRWMCETSQLKNPSHLSPAFPHTHTRTPYLFLMTDSVPLISNLLSLFTLFIGWVHSRSITSNRVWLWSGRWKGPCVQQRPLTSFQCCYFRYWFCSVCILLCEFSYGFRRLSLLPFNFEEGDPSFTPVLPPSGVTG